MSETKTYGLGYLVGKKIASAEINKDKDIIKFTCADGESIFACWVGECCAKCFIEHVEGSHILNYGPMEVTSVENTEWVSYEIGYDCRKSFMGSRIVFGYTHLIIETRLEDNGYYGGEIKLSSTPVDQYGCAVECKEFIKLADF